MRASNPFVSSICVLGSSAFLAALLLAALVAFGYVAQGPAQAAEAPPRPPADSVLPSPATTVSSDITSDTTWTLADSPVEVAADVTVVGPATLTIQPGVTVQFQQNFGLSVDATGRLVAVGTASQPITFTGTNQQPGWWDGLVVQGTVEAYNSGSRLSYVTIEYGGPTGTGRSANLFLTRAAVTVTNSLIRNSAVNGIFAESGGVAHISNTVFTGNQEYAVLFNDGSVNPVLGPLRATGNGLDGVGIGHQGVLTGTHTWEYTSIPYILNGNVAVAAGGSLTIEPGVEVRSVQTGDLTVNGRLTAVGTASQPITFTGQFTTPIPGWWSGLSIDAPSEGPRATATFRYVTLEYGGGAGSTGLGGDLSIYPNAVVTVTDSLFRNGSKDGIFVWGQPQVSVSDSSFTANGRYAVQFTSGSANPVLGSLTATGNVFNAVAMGQGFLEGDHTWEYTGIPYIVTWGQTVDRGSSLTVEPGVEVQFEKNVTFGVWGKLTALGTPSRPITFTGTTKDAGWWGGVEISGSWDQPAAASLDYVTLEYGGTTANLSVSRAQASIFHSIIRYSSTDGVYVGAYTAAGVTIEGSQLVNNAGYGLRNTDETGTVLAANNWWGSASGPTPDDTACGAGGTGSRASRGVEFRPWLTSSGADPGLVAPSEARILSLTPQRWFVPADGVTRAWVTITLRDGNGQPIPGRTVRLNSSLGTVMDGAATDVQGQSLAYVTSSTPGEAQLTPLLTYESACETARQPSARVTFTSVDTGADLAPDAAAPYANGDLMVDSPVTAGIATRIWARLRNPNDFPITVNTTFGIAQFGLGLTFGPVGEVLSRTIPANGEGIIETVWVPPIPGHYCVRLEYAYRAASASGVSAAEEKKGSLQRNVDVNKGGPSRNLKEWFKEAKKALDHWEHGRTAAEVVMEPAAGLANQIGNAVPGYMFNQILDFIVTAGGQVSGELAGQESTGWEPQVFPDAISLPGGRLAQGQSGGERVGQATRGDYTILASLEQFSVPQAQAGPDLPAARAAAFNDLLQASVDWYAKLRAAVFSLERQDGASQAGQLEWASRQAGALRYYENLTGAAAIILAAKLEAMVQELRNEGIQDIKVTADAVRAYQARLRSQGFSAEELEAARAIKLSSGQREAIRQARLAASPDEVAGSVMTLEGELAAALRSLGQALISEAAISGGASAAVGQQGSTTNNLARVYSANYSFQVGNPLTQTATISLTVRRVDIPPDWMVTVRPMTVTLAAGAQATVTTTVEGGSATVQGTQPRVAVEGYVGSQLIGGVALDVMVPRTVAFDGKFRIYLPFGAKPSSGGW